MAYATAIVSVMGSIAATIMAATGGDNKIVAIMAILPAAAAAINSTLRFEPKANWFYERKNKLAELCRKLQYENVDPAEVSRELSSVEQVFQQGWIGFGKDIKKESEKENA